MAQNDFYENLNGQLIAQRILLAYALGLIANSTSDPSAVVGALEKDALQTIENWGGFEGLDPDKTREAARSYVTEFFAHLHLKA